MSLGKESDLKASFSITKETSIFPFLYDSKIKRRNFLNKTNRDIFKNSRYSVVFKEFGKMLGYKRALSLVYIKIVAIRPSVSIRTLSNKTNS